jgi:hypothetical protein
MEALISTLFRIALAPIAKALVALLGPTLRSLQSYGLNPADLGVVLAHVADLYAGKTPAFAPLALLTADEVKDVAESIHALFVALVAEYGIVLTAEQASQLLGAVAARVQAKFPAA